MKSYKRSPQKTEAQKQRLLNSLTYNFQPCSEICKKSNLLIGRGKELLNELRNENKVELKTSISGLYTYWKLSSQKTGEQPSNAVEVVQSSSLSSDNNSEVKE